jgi:hypothetical protein
MSDSPAVPDAGKETEGLPRRGGLRLSEAGFIAAARLEQFGDGSLRDALVMASSIDGDSRGPDKAPLSLESMPAPVSNEAHPPAAAEDAYDEFQPMLDLRLPEVPGMDKPSTMDDTPTDALAEQNPSDDVADGDGSNSQNVMALPPPSEPGSANGVPMEHQASSDAAAAIEVSPIFSALDAVERQTDATPQAAEVVRFVSTASAAPSAESTSDASDDLHAASPHSADAEPATTEADPLAETTEAAPAESSQLPPTAQAPASPSAVDTAAKIAAEANATAEALENLKRLLAQKLPPVGVPIPPAEPASTGAVQPPPVHFLASQQPALELPVDEPAEAGLPPPMAGGRSRSGGLDMRGFLAGFALSWAFGIVLYVYLVSS